MSPSQITLLVPSIATPDFTAYAAFEVQNGDAACPTHAPAGSQCPTSKLVTMYTNYSAPGVFSVGQNGFGPAAAENATYSAIGANNPAKPGDIPMLFLTGMGPVTPSLADGVPSSPTGEPLNFLNIFNQSALRVYFDGVASPNIPFAGVAPGYAAGLYQIDAQIPSSVSSGNDFVDILTPDAEAEQATLNIAGASSSASVAVRGKAMREPSGGGRRAARRGPALSPQPAPVSR